LRKLSFALFFEIEPFFSRELSFTLFFEREPALFVERELEKKGRFF